MNRSLWALPGPRRFVAEITRLGLQGRHVAVIVPACRYDDEFVRDLAWEVASELAAAGRDPRRLYPNEAEDLVTGIGRAIDDIQPPVTVPDLLDHAELGGAIGVLAVSDLTDSQRCEVGELLRRIEVESRTRPAERRLTLISVVGRSLLPMFSGGATSDVTLANLWWWNRISRWDVAAYLADLDTPSDVGGIGGVLAEVRSETIVEIGRWDLPLVEDLASSWSGAYEDLGPYLDADTLASDQIRSANGRMCGVEPEGDLLDAWDRSELDGWHGRTSLDARGLDCADARLARLVWAAQARVLLPWIDQRRDGILRRTTDLVGLERLTEAVNRYRGGDTTTNDVIEVGPLYYAINAMLGKSEPSLRDAARRLRDARNKLAHLQPLPLGQMEALVLACEFLG